MARAFDQEAACGILEQYTTQDTKTELTDLEVSQQLWFQWFVNQPVACQLFWKIMIGGLP